MIKFLSNSWDRHPGKMMLLHDINDNILIPYPSYLGVYQDKAK